MSQARAADVEKMKLQMMQVSSRVSTSFRRDFMWENKSYISYLLLQAMNIKDPKELQRMAREYCKDMAVELTLPAYHRFAFAIKIKQTPVGILDSRSPG